MDIRDFIVGESDRLFCQFGFKSVTMDDIAKHLGMSKKTIYGHFSDKNDLVNTVMAVKLDGQTCMIDEHIAGAENAVHEVFFAVTNIKDVLSNMNPVLFYDLHKYHPEASLSFKEFREKKLFVSIQNNLRRGVNEGLYREDIKVDIITQMRLEQIDLLFTDSSAYTQGKYTILQVIAELTEHFLYGICTLKGHKMVNKYKEIIEED